MQWNPHDSTDKLYTIHHDRPSVLKPLSEREEAIYFLLSSGKKEVPSFPAHLFRTATGVALVEGKGQSIVALQFRRVMVTLQCPILTH